MGSPNSWMVYNGNSIYKMIDDGLGVSPFWEIWTWDLSTFSFDDLMTMSGIHQICCKIFIWNGLDGMKPLWWANTPTVLLLCCQPAGLTKNTIRVIKYCLISPWTTSKKTPWIVNYFLTQQTPKTGPKWSQSIVSFWKNSLPFYHQPTSGWLSMSHPIFMVPTWLTIDWP